MASHFLRRGLIALLTAVLLLATAAPARAQVDADYASFEVAVAADGSLLVTESLTFSATPGVVTQVLPASAEVDAGSSRRFAISEVTAGSGPAGFSVDSSTTSAGVEVRLSADAPGTMTWSYRVAGAAGTGRDAEGDLTVVSWPVLSGLSVGVGAVSGTISAPAVPKLVDCLSGPPGSVGKCALISGATAESADVTVQDGARAAGDEVLVIVGFVADDVAANEQLVHSWSLDRAFTLTWPTVLAALAAALIGGAALALLARRSQLIERNPSPKALAQFVPIGGGESVLRPIDGIRPGHVGTLVDESVDPIDITATLLDLAVRGHLRIEELPRGPHQPTDWTLTRTEGTDEPAEFEARLLAALGEEPVRVSQLATVVAAALPGVRDALYDDVVRRGWFASRPDSTRSSSRRLGHLVLAAGTIVAAALIAFTEFGLLALVLLGLAAAAAWLAERLPRRTAAGCAALAGLRMLAGQLVTEPTEELPETRGLAEASRILPYTVVLGGRTRWLDALVSLDPDPDPDPDMLDWYHAPDTWHLSDLPSALDQFITTVQGLLVSR